MRCTMVLAGHWHSGRQAVTRLTHRKGQRFLADSPDGVIIIADKASDADAIRRLIEVSDLLPNILFKANRRWKGRFSPFLKRRRNAIERMFCGLKDFRCIVTRSDKRADTFLAALRIAAPSRTGY